MRLTDIPLRQYREPASTGAEGESSLDAIVDKSGDEKKARMNFPIEDFVRKNKLELVRPSHCG